MPTQEQINAAIKAGYTPQQIKLALARGGERKTSALQKVGKFGMDVLNAPSYALGGALRGAREKGTATDMFLGSLKGVKEGFTSDNAPTVYRELPKTLGLKEGSAVAMAVGLGGELLTPNIPIAGLLGKAGKAVGASADVSRLGKFGSVGQDVGRTLLEKSYKLSASDIDKIAEAIGATDPATKSMKVIDYLEGLRLGGSTRGSLQKLGTQITGKQAAFDKLAKTGMGVSRQPFIDQLLEEAIQAEKIDTPQSRQLSKKLFDEAYAQSKKYGVMTDTELSEKISRLFSEAGESAISDPTSANAAKRMAVAGQSARELLRPGTSAAGRELRGMITAQEVLGKKANTGLGTQLVNAFKPSAFGFGVGAGLGAARGESPIASGLVGAGLGIAANNPAVLNRMGKLLSKSPSLPKAPQLPKMITKLGSKVVDTAIRSPGFTKPYQPTKKQEEIEKPQTYASSVPQNVFRNKSAFGSNKKVKAGAFN